MVQERCTRPPSLTRLRISAGCLHGTGRIISRRVARENLDLEARRADMEGNYSTSASERTIDDIIGPIAESVDTIDVMKPIYNFKVE